MQSPYLNFNIKNHIEGSCRSKIRVATHNGIFVAARGYRHPCFLASCVGRQQCHRRNQKQIYNLFIVLLLNYTLFAIDDVDARRQGVQVGGIVSNLYAVDVVNGSII